MRKAASGRRWSVAAAMMAILGGAGDARAEGPVSGTGKGIVGGGLLGGEVVMLTMGAIGIDTAWPYLVFGGVGAIGGGIGGYFVESATTPEPAEVPLYMLAGGMALVIPTVIVVLNSTAYKPPESDQSEPIQNEPASEPPRPGGAVQMTTDAGPAMKKTRARRPEVHAAVPRGLVDIDLGADRLAFGVPAFEIRPLYSREEIFRFGVEQGHELRFPVVRAAF